MTSITKRLESLFSLELPTILSFVASEQVMSTKYCGVTKEQKKQTPRLLALKKKKKNTYDSID